MKKPTYIELRRDICSGCEYRKTVVGVSICSECGCNIWAKTMFPTAVCPKAFWGTKEEMMKKYELAED